uniref:Uncharacterized protein n=1 Tax=Chromera velia CCMP2878 TaxID=1169474 RepID=A0A0G4HA22_9ALVE|eukprot:Cvel_5994.t1-p1 / transcript=Cvel_5994.t1 / gene=Cvel_5994 / organism=Chromera_velia_CCMP2878 / gene_product=hypothetical protein / transcript_product=hypothetical protein / location=Cvel_scaffold287:19609-23305(+) / protein_length=580 / sequence_SO=supercontig / SO=protein_coding / is_pseudo=false
MLTIAFASLFWLKVTNFFELPAETEFHLETSKCFVQIQTAAPGSLGPRRSVCDPFGTVGSRITYSYFLFGVAIPSWEACRSSLDYDTGYNIGCTIFSLKQTTETPWFRCSVVVETNPDLPECLNHFSKLNVTNLNLAHYPLEVADSVRVRSSVNFVTSTTNLHIASLPETPSFTLKCSIGYSVMRANASQTGPSAVTLESSDCPSFFFSNSSIEVQAQRSALAQLLAVAPEVSAEVNSDNSSLSNVSALLTNPPSSPKTTMKVSLSSSPTTIVVSGLPDFSPTGQAAFFGHRHTEGLVTLTDDTQEALRGIIEWASDLQDSGLWVLDVTLIGLLGALDGAFRVFSSPVLMVFPTRPEILAVFTVDALQAQVRRLQAATFGPGPTLAGLIDASKVVTDDDNVTTLQISEMLDERDQWRTPEDAQLQAFGILYPLLPQGRNDQKILSDKRREEAKKLALTWGVRSEHLHSKLESACPLVAVVTVTHNFRSQVTLLWPPFKVTEEAIQSKRADDSDITYKITARAFADRNPLMEDKTISWFVDASEIESTHMGREYSFPVGATRVQLCGSRRQKLDATQKLCT